MWENRSNVAEAAKVVDTLYDILQDHKNGKVPTIGIITFNDQQRNIIMDEIENRQKKDPAFDELYKEIETPASGKKDDEIFVRNIENVQGDERDIIIFSVGYAKDPEGKFRLQFGTLNQDGGENRLNVAVTRASQKIVVVCSIDPRDMKVEGTKNPGPKRLKDFLVYAHAVSNGDTEKVIQILESLSSGMNKTQQQTKQFDSEFEELVHDRLENLGYTVETQVGQSGYRIDLAIVHPKDPSKYILGVECDGAMFHSGKSVRERDVMRQKFLERRGWTIDRIWSRNWWRNPDGEVQRIKEKIDSLV
jgi:very-short-patch-repair endonuclease